MFNSFIFNSLWFNGVNNSSFSTGDVASMNILLYNPVPLMYETQERSSQGLSSFDKPTTLVITKTVVSIYDARQDKPLGLK